jgi:hypothetical protein
VSAGTARALPVEVAARRTASVGIVEREALLTRREATLRSAATMCLAGIALVQAIALPSLRVQGWHFAVLAVAAIALCLGLGFALAAAPARVARQLWGVVAAAGVLVLAGWAVPHAFAVPGLADHAGHWEALPGAACGALGAGCLVLAALAAPPTRAAARPLATAAAVLVALAPGVGVALVALGPGPRGGETALAARGHVHSPAGLDQTTIQFQPLPGGRGGHYVYRAVSAPRHTALGLGLAVAAALAFAFGAVGHLRRRSAPRAAAALAAVQRGPV